MAPAYYMVNCAHPTHFLHELNAGARGSPGCTACGPTPPALSHAELDKAAEDRKSVV